MKNASYKPDADVAALARDLEKRWGRLKVDAFYVWQAAPVQPGDVIYHFDSAKGVGSRLELTFLVEGDAGRRFEVIIVSPSTPRMTAGLLTFDHALAVALPGILDARRTGEEVVLKKQQGELSRRASGPALEMSIVAN